MYTNFLMSMICILCIFMLYSDIEGRICTCPPGYIGNGVGPIGCLPATGSCDPNPCIHGTCTVSP